MGRFALIRASDIDASLSGATRQYLVGSLKRPQVLDFVPDERLEIGVTLYETASSEAPHRHTHATEFQYLLSGWTEYVDVDDGTVHSFVAGDFYVIHPGTAYAQRAKAGTRILFVKVPSVDDKQVLSAAPEVVTWMESSLRSRRVDHYHEESAPSANSIRPAAAAAVVDAEGRLLLLRRRDSGKWTMPGGTLEFGESLPDCAIRELQEESGLRVQIVGLIGTYTDPDIRVEYSDGEIRQEFTVVFAARVVDGATRLDDESTEYSWVSVDEALTLDLAESQRRRLSDVGRYLSAGDQHLG